jgi:hypothetical protein
MPTTLVQPHCIFFFFQCRTWVVADCFKFCGTRHSRHTQLMPPRLCTTKHFTMTQLKLFTLVGRSSINSWTSTETYTSDLVTAEPEVNIGSSRRGPIMTLSETPSKEQHENGTTWGSWFLLLVSFWSTADWSDQNCLFTTREVDQRG